MKNTRLIIIIAAFFVAGCADSSAINKSNDGLWASPKQSIFTLLLSDTDIINEVLTSFNNLEGKPDYNAAKIKLAMLIREYPQSKWIAGARALMLSIDNLLALQSAVKTDRQELDKANAEKAKLKIDYKYLEEKYQTETMKLREENEQLKNDIAVLKQLDIEMNKREKMLK